MTKHEMYLMFVCGIVFVMFVVVFSIMLVMMMKMFIRLIKNGAEDSAIIGEYQKEIKDNRFKSKNIFSKIFTILICIISVFILVLTIFLGISKNTYESGFSLRVVQSGSMSFKHTNNYYLEENNLDNQIETYAIVLTYKLPKEEDLKLYDIVLYQYRDILVMHRIIRIEEPNINHPNERRYIFRGDANPNNDVEAVSYNQMRAIYSGFNIPFLGSFVNFLQSPIGLLCILFIVFASIATPVMENLISTKKLERLAIINPDLVKKLKNDFKENQDETKKSIDRDDKLEKNKIIPKINIPIKNNNLKKPNDLSHKSMVIKDPLGKASLTNDVGKNVKLIPKQQMMNDPKKNIGLIPKPKNINSNKKSVELIPKTNFNNNKNIKKLKT